MYQKPTIARFGSFRELTQAGCTGNSDNIAWTGPGPGGTSVGDTPRRTNGTIDYCFTDGGSR